MTRDDVLKYFQVKQQLTKQVEGYLQNKLRVGHILKITHIEYLGNNVIHVMYLDTSPLSTSNHDAVINIDEVIDE